MDTLIILLLKWKRKRKDLILFWVVILLITIISACVPHSYLLGFDGISHPKVLLRKMIAVSLSWKWFTRIFLTIFISVETLHNNRDIHCKLMSNETANYHVMTYVEWEVDDSNFSLIGLMVIDWSSRKYWTSMTSYSKHSGSNVNNVVFIVRTIT